ncbi:MAG: hypothetical protein N3A54_02585 [Patescibacteria group bacterium]|nr:hypothetical protein [Patescibacteria group bacterium]
MKTTIPPESVLKKPNDYLLSLRWMPTKWLSKKTKWILFDEQTMITNIQKIVRRKKAKHRYLFYLNGFENLFDTRTYKINIIDLDTKKEKTLTLSTLVEILKSPKNFDYLLSKRKDIGDKVERELEKVFLLRNIYSSLFFLETERYILSCYKITLNAFEDSAKKIKKVFRKT